MTRLILIAAAAWTTLHAADPLYESAQRKLDAIQARQVRRGSTVVFPSQEINAWARVKVPEIVPEGIRDERVELGTDTASAFAMVDLLKMRQGKGESTNWLMTRLIEGERPLKVTIHMESGGGRCKVDLTRVEISNVVANGGVLDFLVKTFFLPLYPDAHINEPFDLDFDIDRIDLRPTGVIVAIKK